PRGGRGHLAEDPDSRLHDFRVATRLRDRLPAIPALPDHRPRGGIGSDVDGHDDAAAGRGVAAVQADLLRAGRRLVARGRKPGAKLRPLARFRAKHYARTWSEFAAASRQTRSLRGFDRPTVLPCDGAYPACRARPRVLP